MTYPQQPQGGQGPAQFPNHQFPNHQYGGLYGGGYPPPPPKKKAGPMLAVVAIAVLVLGGLGITGFVAPGFFLSDDQHAAPPPPGSSSAEPSGASAEDFLQTLVDALNTRDAETLRDITCPEYDSTVDIVLDDLDTIDGATLVDSEEVSDDEVVATIDVVTAAGAGFLEMTVLEDGGEWCWQDVTGGGPEPTGEEEPTGGAPTANGKPVATEPLNAMQSFLDAINGGDTKAAKSMLCPDAISAPSEVDELVGYQPNLEIDPTIDGLSTGDDSVQLYLRGTANGEEIDGYATNLWVTGYDGPWCVHAFRVIVV